MEPVRRKTPFAPSLQGDDRGAPQWHDNIHMMDYATGEETEFNMAEPASTDPTDPINIRGAFYKRHEEEEEAIKDRKLHKTTQN